MKDKAISFQIEDGKMYLLFESGKMYMSLVGQWQWQKLPVPEMTRPQTP
jgi:hypothetical protein